MENENRSYRIRTQVGSDAPNVINVKLNQTFEFLNILSLKIGQKNLYKMPAAPYGIVCGRVLLGGKSFGVQNAKVSIFISKDSTVFDVKDDILYTYSSVDSVNYEGVRYNLLPSYVDNACHQNVGTMFEKEYVLDNNDVIRIFDNYYSYTTTTNNAGDYFIYGVPVGQYTLHVDVDLSDIGQLSVRPHDMIGQGYNIDQFESPNKFKADKNLNILPQIKSTNKPVYIYPFWGDTSENDTNAMITRADIEIDYKFEPTAVFIGSIVTDKGANSISHKCIADDKTGKMSELITGEGMIEMIRKTFDGKVEQFSVKGNRLIDGDGVWCYQVPMNLDYVVMDEFGNIVPTDNPDKGIPTRARVRFRISLDENPMDDSARKRARFLVPNNPRLTDDYPNFSATHEPDYEFGTFTKEESYRDMFWNNVYTVKSYIPRLQKRITANTKKHTGIKATNHAGDNNPMPFNNLKIKMNFVFRFLCVILTIFLYLVWLLNAVLAPLGWVIMALGSFLWDVGDWLDFWPFDEISDWFKDIGCSLMRTGINMVIKLDSDFCDDGGTPKTYILGPGYIDNTYTPKAKSVCGEYSCTSSSCSFTDTEITRDMDTLLNCVQNELAQDNEVTSFDFQNDWVNGVLYAPLWYRKIKPKRKIFFGLIKVGGQDDWCDGNSTSMAGSGFLLSKGLKMYQTCAQQRAFNDDITRKSIKSIPLKPAVPDDANIFGLRFGYKKESKKEDNCYGYKCHKMTISFIRVDKGVVIRKETKYGEYVYYYKAVEYDNDKLKNIANPGTYGEVKLLFATDLVLLGSLNDCDSKGVPQFFKHLNETTYNMPPNLMSLTWNVIDENVDGFAGENINEGVSTIDRTSVHTEYSGADTGNAGWDQWYNKDKVETDYTKDGGNERDNGGLFYDLNCNFSYVKPKSCINLSRVCEFGVNLDQSITFLNQSGDETVMPPDGFISYDELYNSDARAMFATMNGNRLREKQDKGTGFPTYNFNYMYPENFDGTLKELMKEVDTKAPQINPMGNPINYRKNYNLEQSSNAYLLFRYGYVPNVDDFKVAFYDTDIKTNMYKSFNELVTEFNRRRFPRYENSFYFYFGLKSGKTAIDKFRRNFYAECTNDAESESSITIEYSANTWCTNTTETLRDGWVSFDLSNVELPCAITLDERNQGALYDVTYTDINSYKLYIGTDNSELNNKGYDRLYVDDDKKQKPVSEPVGMLYHPVTVVNGYYTVTITDANGEQFRQNISFEAPKVKYDVVTTAFTMTNSELDTAFPPTASQTRNQRVASDTVHNLTDNSYVRDIGGYITVTNITNDGSPLTDNFLITIRYIDDDTMTDYAGSDYEVLNGVVTRGGIQPLSEINGEYVFGVPRANENYVVTIYQLCEMDGMEHGNYVQTRVFVSEPQPFRMFVNGVDTALLTKFKVGYKMNSSGVINAPYTGYNESDGVRSDLTGSVRGWLSINDVGVPSLLNYPQEGTTFSYVGAVENAVNALRGDVSTDLYVFTDEYTFQDEDVNKNLEIYADVPQTIDMQTRPKYIRVKRSSQVQPFDPFDNVTWIYEYDQSTDSYLRKLVNGQPVEDVTIGEYFDACDYYGQCEVIDVINEIINRRLGLVESMINAFWMYDANEANKTITITYQTNETPVNTVVYYIPDETNATRVPVSVGATRYRVLDSNMSENTITSFAIPTITKNGSFNKPIFYKDAQGNYKLPPHCGIKNRLNVTIPSTLTAYPFSQPNITTAMSSLHNPEGMENMFGFHVIDKRPFTRSNIWIPIYQHPIYWPDVVSDPNINHNIPSVVDGFVEGNYINMNGCISGFFYNGFSTSQTHEAEFITQKATDNINLYTITVDADGNPDEFAVPTKRLIYRSEPESSYVFSYNDFKKTTNPRQGFDSDSQDTGGVNTDYRYIPYNTSTSYLTVTDNRSSFNENLYPTSTFGITENTVVDKGVAIQPTFTGISSNVQFTIVTENNPVYSRVYNNSSELPVGTKYNMTYNAAFPSGAITVIPNDSSLKRFYCVGYTTDGKYRGISPTYEIGAVDVHGEFNSAGNYTLRVKFTDNPNNQWDVKDYYIRKYPYQFIIDWTETVDDVTVEHEIVSGLIPPTYDSLIPSGNVRYTDPYEITETFFPPATFYVKDITGIRRKVNFVQ